MIIHPVKTKRRSRHFLDEYVIGQDDAKKVLSVAAYTIIIKERGLHPARIWIWDAPKEQYPDDRPHRFW